MSQHEEKIKKVDELAESIAKLFVCAIEEISIIKKEIIKNKNNEKNISNKN